MVWLKNHYRCTECGTEWHDEWDCACDDDCPECGTTMTPRDSEEIEGGPDPREDKDSQCS
ncbi:hypothetical protein [Burkholderia cepacia]|uniref:hypothetical protein n=1 Tax=Burkholderia cepacia TaxID=292 RepID=UPI0015761B70|nr:hypothetical protein [Burkholderia cepacia]